MRLESIPTWELWNVSKDYFQTFCSTHTPKEMYEYGIHLMMQEQAHRLNNRTILQLLDEEDIIRMFETRASTIKFYTTRLSEFT